MGRGTKVSAVVPIKTYAADEVDFGGLDYLKERGISEDTAKTLGVCSGRKFFKKSGTELDAIGFPYRHQGRVTAIKWRSISTKEFTQDGSAQTLFLADKIEPGQDIVITEGELDAVIVSGVLGIPAVGCPGVANWKSHYPRLFNGYDTVYVVGDHDVKEDGSNPGAEFNRRVASEVMNATIVNLPAGLDITDYYLQNGYDKTRRLLGVVNE